MSVALRLSNIARRHTRASAMLVAGCKGAGADAMSQCLLQPDQYDPSRTLAFGVWSGGYCGGVLYLLYNRFFPRFFPVVSVSGASMSTSLRIRNTMCMVSKAHGKADERSARMLTLAPTLAPTLALSPGRFRQLHLIALVLRPILLRHARGTAWVAAGAHRDCADCAGHVRSSSCLESCPLSALP